MNTEKKVGSLNIKGVLIQYGVKLVDGDSYAEMVVKFKALPPSSRDRICGFFADHIAEIDDFQHVKLFMSARNELAGLAVAVVK